MLIQKIVKNKLEKMKKLIDDVNDDEVNDFIESILNSNNIFTLGSGLRKSLAEALASKLVKNGISCYIIGNVSTPSVKKNDCIIAFSKSGESDYVVTTVKIAEEKINPKIISITSNASSSLNRLSDLNILIKQIDLGGDQASLLKDLHPDFSFEIITLLFIDHVINKLIARTKYDQSVL
jgi:6-phospho-3-hexuloisomerase